MRKSTTSPTIRYLKLFTFSFCLLWMTNINAEVIYSIPLKGVEHQIGNMLEWETAEEIESHLFVVERSIDGINYEELRTIEAAGSSLDEKSYHFLDLGINDKKAYYRLRQIDTDGTASFSQTVMVKKKMSNQFMVVAMSNPFPTKGMSITLESSVDAEMEYCIHNIKGEQIMESKQMLEPGLNTIEINMEDEKIGTYIVMFKMNNEEENIIIQKIGDEIKTRPNVASQGESSGG